MQRVIFLILPDVEILDLAGPLQALYEANRYGAYYEILLCAKTASVPTLQDVYFSKLQPLVEAAQSDLVIVPGISVSTLSSVETDVLDWLRRAAACGAQICSICTGAFILAKAGLLDGCHCTTHWSRIEELRQQFPKAKIVSNKLYVQDGKLITSAGIAAGIDLTLSLIEQQNGARLAAAVAREMVIYFRRNDSYKQESIYLDYRSHVHAGIHRVQDAIVNKPEDALGLSGLARIANMSERNMTRIFRQVTGISIGEYVDKIRLEVAKNLLTNSNLSIELIAAQCGFSNVRQLRRISQKYLGIAPSTIRKHK